MDNFEEISVFRTKYEYVDISMDLLNWKALATNKWIMSEYVDNFWSLNDNELIGVSYNNIFKYYIDSNQWKCHELKLKFTTKYFEALECCLNAEKTVLYILYHINRMKYKWGTNTYFMAEINLYSLRYQTYGNIEGPHFVDRSKDDINLSMLMVENTIHFMFCSS